jgi:hypothetical protein
MSELGQFRKSDCVSAMSALPPLATELLTSLEVRFVPFGSSSTDAAKRKAARRRLSNSNLMIEDLGGQQCWL